MTDVLLTKDLIKQLDDVNLQTAYWEGGITNTPHLDHTEKYSGIRIPQDVRDFVEAGHNPIPPEKDENTFLIQLADVDLGEKAGLCYWDGKKQFVQDTRHLQSTKPKLSWTWSAMEQSVNKKKTEFMERFHNIGTNDAPFTPFVKACITKCIISCLGNHNKDGCEITVLSNSANIGTFVLPAKQVHAIFDSEMVVNPMEQVYMQIRNLSSSSTLTDIVFDMYLEEI